MKITLITIGRLKDKFFIDASAEYEKRLSKYCKLDIKTIEAARLPSDPSDSEVTEALKEECEKIKKALPGNCDIIPMCIEGKQLSSEELSEKIETLTLHGTSHICFIIGGSYGISEEIKKLASLKLSMSRMTFPHRLARIMLLEQLYRAFKISEGSNYHK